MPKIFGRKKPVQTTYWNQWYGDSDDWGQGGEDTDALGPERNKGKMGHMPEGWSEEHRKKVDHVICPDCSATVYASGYMVRDRCDVCWANFPSKELHMPQSKEAAKANKASQGTHTSGTWAGSYNKSLSSFTKQRRSDTESSGNREH